MINPRTGRSTVAPQDTIIVASLDAALATGHLAAAGNACNISDGEVGLLSTDFSSATIAANNFVTAGVTALQVKRVKFLRGTPNSANLLNVSPYNLNDKAYIASAEIVPERLRSVTTTLPEIASYNMQLLTAFTAPVVGTDYVMNLALQSVTRDIEFAPQKRDWRTYVVTTPATAPTDITDWLLQTMATKANQESIYRNGAGRPFIVFGVATDGTPGTVINTIAAGTVLSFMTDAGTTWTYTADIPFVKSLQNAIANGTLAGTESIVNLNSVAAGTLATVDALLVVGLDEVTAAIYDEETRNKVRVNAGFESIDYTSETASNPVDWIGTGKQWKLEWKRRMGNRNYFTEWYANPLNGGQEVSPSYITNTVGALYTSTIIEFDNGERPSSHETFVTPHRLTILIPASITNPTANAATPFTVATTNTTLLTTLNSIFGAWLNSANTNFSNIEYYGNATAATPFV
jgi:hypothetical protein